MPLFKNVHFLRLARTHLVAAATILVFAYITTTTILGAIRAPTFADFVDLINRNMTIALIVFFVAVIVSYFPRK